MFNNITLTSSMRSNLYALKNLSTQMSTTQNRLASGLKVNSAIDNANSYYQARALNNRASDLDMLLDAMGQSIQTISTAATAIDKAMSLFEQMSSIAEEAASQIPEGVRIYQGEYQEINSSMTTSQIQQAINHGGVLSLQDDITISQSLNIGDNVTIIGNGHSITYEGIYGFRVVNDENVAGDAALKINGNTKISGLTINYTNTNAQGVAIAIDGGSAEIDNITINASTTANRMYGIQVLNGGKLQLDSTKNINLIGTYSEKLINGNPDLWAGEYNTQMIVDQMGADDIAAYACNQFYVGSANDENFGQGSWYLPGLGELADMYGTNYSKITNAAQGHSTTGSEGNNKDTINYTLEALRLAGIDAKELTNSNYWSSSENTAGSSWIQGVSNGNRTVGGTGGNNGYVRAFELLENKFAENSTKPQVGDVMYSDLSYSDKDNIDTSKTAVGVVAWVSEDGASIKIVNLKDLRISVNAETGWQEFNPNNPYSSTQGPMKWQNTATSSSGTNITQVKDYLWNNIPNIYTALAKGRGEINVTNTIVDTLAVGKDKYGEQFNTALSAYDNLIKDSSYQGINLLNGNNMTVTFNESRTHNYTIIGQSANADALGISASHWETLSDVKTSIAQLQSAVSTLRNIAEALGNSLRIIETRENFTDAMTDILQVGADDLVLADMNEESANYLALQTRNNLAVNALALAAQAGSAVLKLF